MEKEIRKFVHVSSAIAVALLTVILISSLGLISIYPSEYRRIMIYIIVAASAAFLLLWLVSAEMVKANRTGVVRGISVYPLRLGIRMVLPVFMHFAGFFKEDKNWLGRIYITINNLLVKYELQKTYPEKILALIPHCMQNKECRCRITEDIRNCRRCGGCKIGETAALMDKYGIRAIVAKGGTAARNIVRDHRPGLIIAVACERELVSGIADVGRVPVIGVINQRPNGYCTSTTVDTEQLKKTLNELLREQPGMEQAAEK